MGNLTLVVAALSYAGQLNVTAAADRDGCPDVDVFTHGLRSALDDLERSAIGLETAGLADATESFLQSGSATVVRGGP
jgi:hypothetical protein